MLSKKKKVLEFVLNSIKKKIVDGLNVDAAAARRPPCVCFYKKLAREFCENVLFASLRV